MVFDKSGREIARHQVEHDQILPRPGWVEHDPLQIVARTNESIAGALGAGGLTAADLEERSFYELLRDRYGIVVVGGEQTIEPTVTDEDESKALGVPLHSPAFRFQRVTHSAVGEIVEFVESIYRGDRYRLVTALSIPQERRRSRGGDGRAASGKRRG